MKIFGLTGGIASGKSTVSRIFREALNVTVIDADVLARKAVQPGSDGLKKIQEEFGREILDNFGALDRKALAAMVFADSGKLKKLNSIVHPEVARLFELEVKALSNSGVHNIIYDVPLLIEENLINRVDKVILIVSPEDLQLKRLMKRDALTETDAKNRIKAQMSNEKKMEKADYIIYNDGTLEELKAAVVALWDKVKENIPFQGK
ncbi:MAG: dephospho-CoA kinase [Eubacteriaceae bacterium]|nr:dephospho-CoA kinase [Eubacteriaceae bacterium]